MKKQIENEEKMREIANYIAEKIGNMGFVLITFEFDSADIANYISNAERKTMIKALRESADTLEAGHGIPPVTHKTVQ